MKGDTTKEKCSLYVEKDGVSSVPCVKRSFRLSVYLYLNPSRKGLFLFGNRDKKDAVLIVCAYPLLIGAFGK